LSRRSGRTSPAHPRRFQGRRLSKHEWIESVGPGTRLDIQIIEPNITHTLPVAQLKQWLDRPPTSPADSMKKRKLKELAGELGRR
jgi:hypothetical protein